MSTEASFTADQDFEMICADCDAPVLRDGCMLACMCYEVYLAPDGADFPKRWKRREGYEYGDDQGETDDRDRR